jgi:hypothetical protein
VAATPGGADIEAVLRRVSEEGELVVAGMSLDFEQVQDLLAGAPVRNGRIVLRVAKFKGCLGPADPWILGLSFLRVFREVMGVGRDGARLVPEVAKF